MLTFAGLPLATPAIPPLVTFHSRSAQRIVCACRQERVTTPIAKTLIKTRKVVLIRNFLFYSNFASVTQKQNPGAPPLSEVSRVSMTIALDVSTCFPLPCARDARQLRGHLR